MLKSVLVVCNDAGGAEIISAYIKNNLHNYIFFCVIDGPAKKIFRKKGLKNIVYREKDIEKIFNLKKFDFLLTSIGWSSNLEYKFLKYAQKISLKTVVYMDHWVNYRERFGYPRKNWRNNLPDEIWVGDRYAKKLALEFFPEVKIRYKANEYFKEIKKNFSLFKIKHNYKKKNDFLFISEPVSETLNIFGDKNKIFFDEYKILNILLNFFSKNKLKKIIIRLHPSEDVSKYDTIIRKYKELKIVKSVKRNIFDDLISAKRVIGVESMALVVAHLCGKKVFSFFPNKNKKCAIPIKEILKIGDIKNLPKILS